MTDDDQTVAVEEPVEEPKVEEPAVEQPSAEPVAPAASTTAPAGTDQQGRQLYDVTCADCGAKTQVPFQPSGGRPVYCRDCYMKRKGGGIR